MSKTVPEVKEKWEGDVCEKCGCKDFKRWYEEGKNGYCDFNFMKCKNCGAVYLDD